MPRDLTTRRAAFLDATGAAVLAAALCLLPGCKSASSSVTEYQLDPSSGRTTEVGTFTEEESWKRSIERRIARQVANEPLYCGGITTWDECWKDTYKRLRKYDVPFEGPSELNTADARIAFIKSRLQAHGLPTYE
jgi:hypothetical protein